MKITIFKTLLMMSFSICAFADEVTFLLIESPGINWTSPRTLAKSTIEGNGKAFGLGHVYIQVKCAEREEFTGMMHRWQNDTRDAVLKEGNGLGVLFRVFEGTLQKGENIAASFEKMVKKGRTNFISFRISPTTCQRLLEYHDTYVDITARRQSIPRVRNSLGSIEGQIFYGFPAISRFGEGGGCSGFAMSFLEVAGLKEEWMNNEWSQFRRVPTEAVGRPMREVHVGVPYLLFKSPKRWANEDESHYPLFFWDPDLMFNFAKKALLSEMPLVDKATRFGAEGIIFDRRHIPTPTEPIFVGDIYNKPSDPSTTYTDLMELFRRYDFSAIGK